MAKPHKVEEPAAPYSTSPKMPVSGGAQTGTPAGKSQLELVKANNARLMQVHAKVLRKLAQ
jgi:hypothetical protein